MKRPPKLTTEQKARLGELDPALRRAVRLGDYKKAEVVTKEIQLLLRPTGHETRLMRAKNRLYECAMEAGELFTAIQGLIGVRKKTSPRTRVYLEATALLAICYLRNDEEEKAEPLIAEALKKDANISSKARRVEFKQRLIRRFSEEGLLTVLKRQRTDRPLLDVDSIHNEAGLMVRTNTEDEMRVKLAEAVPNEAFSFFRKVDAFSRKQLPPDERKLLPPPIAPSVKRETGDTVFSALGRVFWRSLCDPKSDVHKMWFEHGFMAAVDKKLITASIVGAFFTGGITLYGLVVPVVAMVMKFGIDFICEKYAPAGITSSGND